MGARDDELLSDPPPGPSHATLHAYRAGSPIRRVVWAAAGAATLGAVFAGVWWARHTEDRLRRARAQTTPAYQASPGARPRELVWTSGRARLGLSRFEPGVQIIRLPDRTLRLAEGSDHAQVIVEIEGGRSRVRVIVGEIVESRPDGSRP